MLRQAFPSGMHRRHGRYLPYRSPFPENAPNKIDYNNRCRHRSGKRIGISWYDHLVAKSDAQHMKIQLRRYNRIQAYHAAHLTVNRQFLF